MTTPSHEKTFPSDEKIKLPRPFILRRLHSLLGIWLAIYLFEHLLVNSQAALYFQDRGSNFIRMVNNIHALPFLRVIEIVFLGVPILIHGYWGVLYAFTSKSNSHLTDGTKPTLPQFKRNKSFTWQRITSWLLIVGIIAHVVHMRFIDYPTKVQLEGIEAYKFPLSYDRALPHVATNLHVNLYSSEELENIDFAKGVKLKKTEVLAVAPNMGTAFFLIVRQAFTNPLLVFLYSIFVIVAAYHGFNGLWTFLITWGVTLSRRSQRRMRIVTTTLMGVVMFLGLIAAWGTYWTTLFQK